MKIGLFTDPHYSDREVTCIDRRPSLSYDKIREAMDAFEWEKAELVICLGDLVDSCLRREDEPAALQRVGGMIRSYGIPFYCLRGNHDCYNFTPEEFYRYGGLDAPPFSVRYGKLLLIFLDANCSAAGELYQPRAIDWTDTYLPQEQVDALEETLRTTDAADIYVFLHQRLDPCDKPEYTVRNAEAVRKILEDSRKVRGVFQGHYHDGDFTTVGGIPYVTLPAMCVGEKNEYRIVDLATE